jgi:hypothetical protein
VLAVYPDHFEASWVAACAVGCITPCAARSARPKLHFHLPQNSIVVGQLLNVVPVPQATWRLALLLWAPPVWVVLLLAYLQAELSDAARNFLLLGLVVAPVWSVVVWRRSRPSAAVLRWRVERDLAEPLYLVKTLELS